MNIITTNQGLDRLYTVREAAAVLSIGRSHLYELLPWHWRKPTSVHDAAVA